MVMRAKLVERSGRELESLVTRREINWLGILLHSIAIFILIKKLPSTSFLRRVSQEVSLTGKRAGAEGGNWWETYRLFGSGSVGWKLDLGESLVNKLVG